MINLKKVTPFVKSLSAIAITLLCYGYVCRLTNIYFFWESKSIGWVLLFVPILLILLQSIKDKKNNNKKAIIEKIGIGLIILILAIKIILFIALSLSDAYSVSKKFLQENKTLNTEIGNINSFSLIPSGGIQKNTDSSGESGYATINLTVKGDLKFKDLTIYISKAPGSNEWLVDNVE